MKEGANAPSFFNLVLCMRESKYNVGTDTEKRSCDGIVFDSIVEMKYYRDVILPGVGSGDIVLYELQKQYVLQPKFLHDGEFVNPIYYVADFYVEYSNGKAEVIDIKGMPDAVAKIKRKMFWFTYPELIYRWICYSKIDGGWCDYDYVVRQRKMRKKSKKEQKERENKNGKQ